MFEQIRACEKHKICPALRLFITKVKKRNLEAQSSRKDGRRNDLEHAVEPNRSADKVELCPPLAGRRQLKSKRAKAKTKAPTSLQAHFRDGPRIPR